MIDIFENLYGETSGEKLSIEERKNQILDRCRGKKDEERNFAFSPPVNERIVTKNILAFEHYTSVHIDKLKNGLKKLNWNKNNECNWIKEQRSQANIGSWKNLGRISNPNEDTIWANVQSDYSIKLPDITTSVHATLYQTLPSVTTFAFNFVLDENSSKIYERLLRTGFETQCSPNKDKSIDIKNPTLRRKEKITDHIKTKRNKLKNWIKKFFPGAFCNDIYDGHIPMCETITFRQNTPFTNQNESTRVKNNSCYKKNKYLDFLGLSENHFAQWQDKDVPSVKFSEYLMNFNIPSYSILTFNCSDFYKDYIWDRSGTYQTSFAYEVKKRYLSILSYWSLKYLLAGYLRQISDLRHKLIPQGNHYYDPLGFINILKNITEMNKIEWDYIAIQNEIQRIKDEKNVVRLESDFTRKDMEANNSDFAQVLLDHLFNQNQKIKNQIKYMSDHIASRLNIILQVILLIFTFVLVGLTVYLSYLSMT